MQWRRSLQDLLNRLETATESGQRVHALPLAESVQPVLLVDSALDLMPPYQRVVVGANISQAAVAAQFSYVGLHAISRPVKVRYLRHTAGADLAFRVVDFVLWQAQTGATVTYQTPEWIEAPQPEAFVPTQPGSRAFVAQSTIAVTPFVGTTPPVLSNGTVFIGVPEALPLLLPGQALIMTQNAVNLAASCNIWWEQLRPADAATSAPADARLVGP